MNEERPESEDPNRDALGSLVRAAGPRAMPQPEQMALARERVHAEWRASVAGQRRQRFQWLAAAGVAALAAGIAFFLWSRPEPAVQVATASRVGGEVQLRRTEDQPQSPLRSGAALLAGGEIATAADGRVLLGWVGGVEVRVDRASRVQIDSATALHLLEGAVYVDTRSSDENSAQLAILTSAGTVRHVGTRFEVRVAGGDTRVRVRDGTALFTGTDHAVVLIASGQQLSVADGQPSLVQGPGPADPAWEWTRAISPQFEIEGRSLYDSVEWLAHEAGLRIVYENGAVRDRAQGVIVHGNIAGLPTREALVAVLTGSGFEFVLDSDQVRIRATEDR